MVKSEIEPVQRQVDSINKTGQGLLQSAAPGVSTTSLESDLEQLNDKWSDLNERVSSYGLSGLFTKIPLNLLIYLNFMDPLIVCSKELCLSEHLFIYFSLRFLSFRL